MAKNPFGDDPEPRRVNPFGEEETLEPVQDAAQRVQNAARKIRLLRAQIGAEGLSPSGTRELLDQFGSVLDIIAGALRELDQKQK
ncbi:MAG TPA: hypothetical protein VFU06_08990 [Longimicrobiales bacterium]|nr:hypothetical protein [Longimicrobiales bacterium]